MWLFFLLVLAFVTPVLIRALARAGSRLREAAQSPRARVARWPSVGLVIPCAGSHRDMPTALKTLLEQNYGGDFHVRLVTATADEPAAQLIDNLVGATAGGRVVHVVAGMAEGCCQKNHNLLAGVRSLTEGADAVSPEVLVFCDSTHTASPDFVERLVAPLALGETDFTTGYHEVVPGDTELVTLSYALCVLGMRVGQSVSPEPQPWGGAMAVRASTFKRLDIAGWWADKVVDDCTLIDFLPKHDVHVKLCPSALLRTRAEHHKSSVFKPWLERQIVYLKFTNPGQWAALGAFLGFLAFVPTLFLLIFLAWLVGPVPFAGLVACGLHLAATAMALSSLRRLLPHHVPLMRMMGAFWHTCFAAFAAFCRTVGATGLLWHGWWYEVGRDGVVKEKRKVA